ncbi:MAG TPA: hypothetical protein O0X22_00625 [Methanocorpusculum sp.]|nr:hypothetical protein [Methanocorpusculum sp.]HJK44840.1 hypothetical protein [Methanocorpusculum sp.]HJK46911.1 hypothetical protein [Methanocorpusculum sp.]HJK57108.1 hypothetical protein [Methanocorpusculum sp.]HJK62567.1 hypothetical protein [Methanocorpusculum sp.]
MVVFKAKKVSAALEKKGFERRSGNVNHCRYEFFVNGRPTGVKTYLSHNNQEITGDLLAWMAKEVYLSKEEFGEMVSCKIGYDDLVSRYAARGFLKTE